MQQRAQQRDDMRLTEEVLAEFQRNSFLRALSLGVEVAADNGIITLTGSIGSEENRRDLEAAARRIVGVVDVRNYLTIMGAESSSRRDDEIVREVREQMASDPTIDDPDHFHVRSQFARVFIAGTAESEEERQSVVAAAQRVPGVQAVEDRMTVNVPLIGEERGPG